MYKRIIILGGSGSGKSTLASKISSYTGYPSYHLDSLFLNSDWSMKDKTTWSEISKIFLEKDVGVVDGNYFSVLPDRIKWADLIIFIDVPTYLQLYRVIKRTIRNRLGLDQRFGHPEASKDKLRLKFLFWISTWNKKRRNQTLSLLKEFKAKKVVIIKNLDDLDLKTLL